MAKKSKVEEAFNVGRKIIAQSAHMAQLLVEHLKANGTVDCGSIHLHFDACQNKPIKMLTSDGKVETMDGERYPLSELTITDLIYLAEELHNKE